MNHLQKVLKEVELDLRGNGKISRETYEILADLGDWDYRIVAGFITEVNLRIQQGNINFVYKKYNVGDPYKNKIKKDLMIACLKRDQRDTVLCDVNNRLVIPQDIS